MLTVDDFAQIRQARAEGASVRALARRFRRSTKTVLKALGQAQPTPYTLTKPRPAPALDAVRAIVDEILARDQSAPPKQRHTATQIFRRLVAEHNYAGSYDPIQRHVKRKRSAKCRSCVAGYDEGFPSEYPSWLDRTCAIRSWSSSGARS